MMVVKLSDEDAKILKQNLLKNELGDLISIYYDKNTDNEVKEKSAIVYHKVRDALKDLGATENEIKKIEKKVKKETINDFDYRNPYHKHMNELAKNDPLLRGDLTEDDLTDEYNEKKIEENIKNKVKQIKQPANLTILDGDYSSPKNTKDIKAYNPEFIEVLKNKFGLNNNQIVENVLKYIPIDVVKNNTIWEIKSFTDDKKALNTFGKTKLEGYKGNIYAPKKGDTKIIKYDFKYADDGKKVKNITFKYKDDDKTTKSIDILKDNEKGYNYYWYMSNNTGTRYFSPLTNERYEKDELNLLKKYNLNIDDFRNMNDDDIVKNLYQLKKYDIIPYNEKKNIVNILTDYNNKKKNKYKFIPEGDYDIYRDGKKIGKEKKYDISKKMSDKLPPSYDMIQYINKIENEGLDSNEAFIKKRLNKNFYIK